MYAIGDRVVVRTSGLVLDALVCKAYPPEYHLKVDRWQNLLLIADESELSPIPASRDLGSVDERLAAHLPDRHCAAPGCGKPIDAGARSCWMCGNPV